MASSSLPAARTTQEVSSSLLAARTTQEVSSSLPAVRTTQVVSSSLLAAWTTQEVSSSLLAARTTQEVSSSLLAVKTTQAVSSSLFSARRSVPVCPLQVLSRFQEVNSNFIVARIVVLIHSVLVYNCYCLGVYLGNFHGGQCHGKGKRRTPSVLFYVIKM